MKFNGQRKTEKIDPGLNDEIKKRLGIQENSAERNEKDKKGQCQSKNPIKKR